jgi:hypothetical protein
MIHFVTAFNVETKPTVWSRGRSDVVPSTHCDSLTILFLPPRRPPLAAAAASECRWPAPRQTAPPHKRSPAVPATHTRIVSQSYISFSVSSFDPSAANKCCFSNRLWVGRVGEGIRLISNTLGGGRGRLRHRLGSPVLWRRPLPHLSTATLPQLVCCETEAWRTSLGFIVDASPSSSLMAATT